MRLTRALETILSFRGSPSAAKLFGALSLLALTGCAGYFIAGEGFPDPDRVDEIEEIKRRLAAVRGLEFTEDVHVATLRKEEFIPKYLGDSLKEGVSEKKLEDVSLAYAKLGLLPLGTDLKKSPPNFYAPRVTGFYSPGAKTVVLLKPAGSHGGGMDKMALVHELTHALQDQHFSLGRRLALSKNDDEELALRSIAEADAVLSELAYRLGGIDGWSWMDTGEGPPSCSAEFRSDLPGIPAAVMAKLLFQYRTAVPFVHRVLTNKGWLGVNRLYSDPPRSTAQVLHPEKYFDLPRPPTKVDLGDLFPLFPGDWREIENNTLGELMVQCLFEKFLSKGGAQSVGRGWDGDRFVAFRQGDHVSFIWVTLWDSPADAMEFLNRYREILHQKYPSLESAGLYAYIEQRDRRVIVVEGLERRSIEDNVEKIWQQMKLEKEPF